MKSRLQSVIVIEVEGEEWGKIHEAILGKNSLPSTHSKSDFKDRLGEIILAGARHYTLKRLSLRSYSTFEVHSFLKERLVPESIITQVLESFINEGYLNDQEWVDATIRGQTRKKAGPRLIKSKLMKKGLSSDQIEQAFVKAGVYESQQAQIKKLMETRFRSKDLKDRNQRDKVTAALLRKGFSWEAIEQALHADD